MGAKRMPVLPKRQRRGEGQGWDRKREGGPAADSAGPVLYFGFEFGFESGEDRLFLKKILVVALGFHFHDQHLIFFLFLQAFGGNPGFFFQASKILLFIVEVFIRFQDHVPLAREQPIEAKMRIFLGDVGNNLTAWPGVFRVEKAIYLLRRIIIKRTGKL